MKKWEFSVEIILASILTVGQYFLAFFVYKLPGVLWLQIMGGVIWVLSVLFAIWPIFILRNKGKPPKGKSYVHTTKLVDSGLYAICRHPQYVAGMLFNLSLMLLAQHELIFAMGIFSMTLMYRDIQNADDEGLEKFGSKYKRYMTQVPRANFLLGIFRLWKKRREGGR